MIFYLLNKLCVYCFRFSPNPAQYGMAEPLVYHKQSKGGFFSACEAHRHNIVVALNTQTDLLTVRHWAISPVTQYSHRYYYAASYDTTNHCSFVHTLARQPQVHAAYGGIKSNARLCAGSRTRLCFVGIQRLKHHKQTDLASKFSWGLDSRGHPVPRTHPPQLVLLQCISHVFPAEVTTTEDGSIIRARPERILSRVLQYVRDEVSCEAGTMEDQVITCQTLFVAFFSLQWIRRTKTDLHPHKLLNLKTTASHSHFLQQQWLRAAICNTLRSSFP